MKKRLFKSGQLAFLILVFSLVLFSESAKAQTDLLIGLPEKVVTSFRDLHPDVSGVSWGRDKDAFVAQYELKQKNHQLWMSDQGKILKHTVVLHNTHLPSVVKQQLYKAFPSCRILSVHQVDMHDKNFYQIRIKNAREKVYYFVDDNGNEVSGS